MMKGTSPRQKLISALGFYLPLEFANFPPAKQSASQQGSGKKQGLRVLQGSRFSDEAIYLLVDSQKQIPTDEKFAKV